MTPPAEAPTRRASARASRRQPTTAFEIGYSDHGIGFGVLRERRHDPGADAGQSPLAPHAAEEHAAHGIDRNESSGVSVRTQELLRTSEGSGAARGDVEGRGCVPEGLTDLTDGAVAVSGAVERIGVLVGPPRVRGPAHDPLHGVEPSDQPVAGHRVRLGHLVHRAAVQLDQPSGRRARAWIHDADELQALEPALLGQRDTEIPRAGLHDGGARADQALLERVGDHRGRGTVLRAAARVAPLQLGQDAWA